MSLHSFYVLRCCAAALTWSAPSFFFHLEVTHTEVVCALTYFLSINSKQM